MLYDPDDPKMAGYVPLQAFRDMDASKSSRRIREKSDVSPVSMLKIKELFEDLNNFADDTAAAIGGIDIGELYRTDSIVKVRVD
ncbi:MAG: hypothetical protein J0J10_00950 [Bosea sp.]|uniref:hypothetical protein n=1 Tax=Bosea sp. (in: a-proteobacteria) TaxID=1871050 RepID=UPI001AD48850|nr:hypothetical protein [Bosea sp. (in: a-proteobacteria)]MBN9467314.1 hypothetical protein [Bosea sp. (in: a-proteobacteria)]